MATKRTHLTTYHLRRAIDGSPITDFEQVIADPSRVETVDLQGDHPFEARLFIATSEPTIPGWVELLEDGFGELDVAAAQRPSAVLIVKTKYYRDHYFALTFGQGRHLLRSDAYDRKYGLRVALNVIYDKNGNVRDPGRLRGVAADTVSANTMHTQRQTDRKAAFEVFGVDPYGDVLRAVTGTPIGPGWGTRISGSDSLSVTPEITFDSLGEFCRSIAKSFYDDSYKEQFSWIDDWSAVQDPDRLDELYAQLAALLLADAGDVQLTVPGLIEWDDVSVFRYDFDPDNAFVDPDDSSVYQALNAAGLVEDLDLGHLRRWHLEALDADDNVMTRWPLLRCLSAELRMDDEATYVFTNGEFFAVSASYMSELDHFIASLPTNEYTLPQSLGDIPDGEYNERAAASSDSYLLLDKRTVRVTGRTSPVEICDVFTDKGAFIHVKRKLGSSSLSHLFAQGTVSADLFLMTALYRNECLDRIREAERQRAEETGDDAFIGRFSTFGVRGVSAADHDIVYAIVAKWNGRSVKEALPFFSKVNLRRHVKDLHRMGYAAMVARVEV